MKATRIIVPLVWAAGFGWLAATSVRLVNLPEMVSLADRVFIGKCLRVEQISAGSVPFPLTRYFFEVRRALKGTQPGETVTFRQVDSGRPGSGPSGLPRFQKGQEVLLFLHEESSLGLTSPVGLSQGVFGYGKTPEGDLGVVNALKNRNLSHGLGAVEMQQMGLAEPDLASLRGGEPIPVEVFASLVDRILRRETSKGVPK